MGLVIGPGLDVLMVTRNDNVILILCFGILLLIIYSVVCLFGVSSSNSNLYNPPKFMPPPGISPPPHLLSF